MITTTTTKNSVDLDQFVDECEIDEQSESKEHGESEDNTKGREENLI